MVADNPRYEIPRPIETSPELVIGDIWFCHVGRAVFGRPLTKVKVSAVTEKTVSIQYVGAGKSVYLRSDITFVEKTHAS